MKNKIKNIIPGLIICLAITLLSKYLANFIPSLGSAPIAILLGIIIGNLLGKKSKVFDKGSEFCESDLLSYSIVLLGGTLSIKAILDLGFAGVGFILIQMISTILVAIYIGKKLGFSENFSLLMASGNAVCGSSAIGATAPAISANDKDKAISITIVNIVGTILMLILPLISSALYNNATLQSSALIGGILQSMGQVVASGSMVNHDVKDLATIFKIVRIIFLVFVVISFSKLKETESEHKGNPKRKIKIPWYVTGFFITCALFSLGIIPPSISKIFKLLSNNFEVIALAGIGMRVKFSDLIKEGVKSSAYGLLVGFCQIAFAILFIKIFF